MFVVLLSEKGSVQKVLLKNETSAASYSKFLPKKEGERSEF